jgi:threonine/homoserine/homoserine lactone efflux protein
VPGIVDYPAFIAAVLVFLMIPGPGTFAVVTSSAKGGPRGGYAALAGLMLGDWVLMAAAMVGVAALLAAHPLLFRGLQYAGAAYLVWVGLQLLRARRGDGAARRPDIAGAHFRQGFLITVVNPKAIVFYMAFLPLFIDPRSYQGPLTLATMAVTIATLTLLYGSVLVWAGHWAAGRLRRNRRIGRWLSRLAGIAVIGFGARLATD